MSRSAYFWLLISLACLLLLYRQHKVSSHPKAAAMPDDEAAEQVDALSQLIRRALRGAFRDSDRDLARNLAHHERLLAAARIRRIYARLLALAERHGLSRKPGSSPLEIRAEMSRLFSGMEADHATITEAYQRVSQGDLPGQQGEIEEVEKAWLRLRAYADILDQAFEARGVVLEAGFSQ